VCLTFARSALAPGLTRCSRPGRLPWRAHGPFDDVVGRAGELGFTDVVAAWPRREGIFAGDEEVLTRVRRPSSR
jgi:hypothetical protein